MIKLKSLIKGIYLKGKLSESINNRLGLCYELSGRYVLNHDGSILVHGNLTNPFAKGYPKIDHAWVEIGDEIFDPVMDKTWSKQVYESLFKVKVYKKYSRKEVFQITYKTEHWGPWEDDTKENILKESVNKTHEKLAKMFIYSVWRYMPREDRFSSYQFSLWMDNDEPLQKLKQKLANILYPNEDDNCYKFFDNDIEPTLEKLQQQKYDRMSKKINHLDPLFMLKSVVKGKTYEGAKQALTRTHLFAWAYKGGRIADNDAEMSFQRLYRHAMGEKHYDERYIKNLPLLSDLSLPSDNMTQTIFIQQYNGYKSQKFNSKVKVWRGTNSPLNKIEPGDFVTFDKDYADSYSRGKYKAVISSILPSEDLRIYRMDVNNSEMIYWPEGFVIKKYEGIIPTFKEFWEQWH